MPYVWKKLKDTPSRWSGMISPRDSINSALDYIAGRNRNGIVPAPPVFEFEVPMCKLRRLDCLAGQYDTKILSPALSGKLQKLVPQAIAVLPVIVKALDEVSHDFGLLRVTTQVAALDEARSRFKDRWSPTALRFHEELVAGMCLVEDEATNLVLVGDELRCLLAQEGFCNLGLYRPEDLDKKD